MIKIIDKLKRVFKVNGAFKNIKAHKNVALNIDKKAQVTGSGTLKLGAVWDAEDPFKSLFCLREGATLDVAGNFRIYSGAKVYVNKKATLSLGSGYINHNVNISCFNKIEIGQGVAISENVTIRDSDNHQIVGSENAMTQPVKIGNKVWIGMNVTILKGVTVGDASVIAAGSVVTNNVPENCLVGGVPARVLKKSVKWM